MAHGIFRNFYKILYMVDQLRMVASQDADDIIRRLGVIVKPAPPYELNSVIKFESPFNETTRYFHELINQYEFQALHEINRRLTSKDVHGSRLVKLLDEIKDELYLLHKHIQTIMNSLALGGCMLESGRMPDEANSLVATKYCIYHYLQVAVVEILCEMHFHFSKLVRDILWTGKYKQLSKVVLPDCQYFDGGHVAEEAVTECTNTQTGVDCIASSEPAPYVPVLGDFRESAKGVIPFDYMIRNAKRFGFLECMFFREGIIDRNNNFIAQHGFKKVMAAISHYLIDKNYFNPIDESKGRRIKPYHVRRFLEHRYQVRFKKQFETSAKDVNERIALIESFEWLSSIPFCENSLN